MAHTDNTLELNKHWDIELNGAGNIVTTKGSYAIAQNVSNECRLFTEDAYFAQDEGIPFFAFALGTKGATSVIRSRLRRAAMNVHGVVEVTELSLESINDKDRTVVGEIQFLVEGGENVTVEI